MKELYGRGELIKIYCFGCQTEQTQRYEGLLVEEKDLSLFKNKDKYKDKHLLTCMNCDNT